MPPGSKARPQTKSLLQPLSLEISSRRRGTKFPGSGAAEEAG